MIVNFRSDTFLPTKKLHPFGFLDFLCNIGGLFGLLAGVSVLSAVEIVYHIAIQFRSEQNRIRPTTQLESNNETQSAWGNQNHALYQLLRYFLEFIRSSNVHGLHYAQDRNQGKCGRIFWSLTIVSSMVFCSIFLLDLYEHAERSPVTITVDSKMWTLNEVGNFYFLLLSSNQRSNALDWLSISFNLCWHGSGQIFAGQNMLLWWSLWERDIGRSVRCFESFESTATHGGEIFKTISDSR